VDPHPVHEQAETEALEPTTSWSLKSLRQEVIKVTPMQMMRLVLACVSLGFVLQQGYAKVTDITNRLEHLERLQRYQARILSAMAAKSGIAIPSEDDSVRTADMPQSTPVLAKGTAGP
jgi:hypothetical protein